MNQSAQTRGKDSFFLAAIGALTALGYSFMGVDFGGRSLSSAEAWLLGVVQPYVIGGIVLASWVRWLILLWLPITFGFGVVWSLQRGVGTFDSAEFALDAVPVIVIWLWFSWRAFFRDVDG